MITNTTDKSYLVKRALSLYLKGQKVYILNQFAFINQLIHVPPSHQLNYQTRGELIFCESFPFISSDQHSVANVELDDIVCSISADICDQIPHADPRWAQITSDDAEDEHSNSGDETNYVIILNQLEDKLITHRTFIELLQNCGAWQALTSLTTTTSILPSKLILLENTEKLIVSLKLRKLHANYDKILKVVISQVLAKRKSDYKNLIDRSHLTPEDLFYQRITQIDDLFWELICFEESQMTTERMNLEENLNIVLSITDMMTSVFAEVCLYRQTNGSIYQSALYADCDYVLWSSVEHVSGVRDVWLKQFDLLIKCTRSVMPDTNCNSIITQSIVDLSDIILDSYVCQLAYLTCSSDKHSALKAAFESNRNKCLMPLLHIKQFEQAASLAEKYEDFDILIKICEELNNHEQLQQYVHKFADKGFSEYLFDWYLKEGKQGKMLSTVSNNYKLTNFLENHETLNWLHQIHLGQFSEASFTLKKLAKLEMMNPARKKTLLSIGKLSSIASGNLNFTDFDEQIKFLNYQNSLSDDLLRKHNLERKALKVLSPEQLVDILTSGVARPNEDMENFRKALEINEIIEKQYSLELYRHVNSLIWRRAFEKDKYVLTIHFLFVLFTCLLIYVLIN